MFLRDPIQNTLLILTLLFPFSSGGTLTCSDLFTQESIRSKHFQLQEPLTLHKQASTAGRTLETELAPLIEEKNWGDLTQNVNRVNAKLAGGFQVSFYDGQPYLSYFENGQSYFALKQNNGRWALANGPHPVETLIQKQGQEPKILKKRFAAPPGMFLVGMETNALGNIVPLFSPSPKLIYFRDLESARGGFFSFFSNLQSDSEREVKIVPLVKMKIAGFLDESDKNIGELPPEFQIMLKNGETLTTEFSAAYTGLEFIVPGPSKYSALIITDNHKLGRTGIVLKDGLPLLSSKDGQEYFLEIKGVGLANKLSERTTIIQERGEEGSVRSGRIAMAYAESELWGSQITQKNIEETHAIKKLYARSVVAVLLPEHDSKFNYKGKKIESWQEVREDLAEENLSSQVFRLSTTTRRIAFTGNPAYGDRYTSQPELLSAAQRFYGKILGDLLIRESSQAIHHSPHPENFAFYPLFKALVYTDYADMEEEPSVSRFLADLGQYHVFHGPEGTEQTKDFLAGLRSSIEPRGFWTKRLNDFMKKPGTVEEFSKLIDEEFLEPINLRNALAGEYPYIPLPHISQFDDDWLHDDGAYRPQLQFQMTSKSIQLSIERLGTIISSSLGQKYFKQYASALKPVLVKLKKLLKESKTFYEKEEKKEWKKPRAYYVKQAKHIFSQQAFLYDKILEIFGQAVKNKDILKKMKIFSE